MTAARDTAACTRLDRWLTAYVDEELDAVHALEVEEHLADCSSCTELVTTLRATRCSLRRVCQMRAPAGLRDRLSRALSVEHPEDSRPGDSLDAAVRPSADREEEATSSQREPDASVRPSAKSAKSAQATRYRYVVPLAAAATVALVFGAMRLEELEPSDATARAASAAPTMASDAALDHLVEELVSQHVHPPPPETTDPESLRRFDQFIGVRVRAPQFDQADVRWVGARMIQRAALMQYMLRDRDRFTMCVFDPRKVPIVTSRLAPRRVGPGTVYVGNVRGYSVAASERDGVGYALASDLSDEESARLVLMAAR